MFTGDPKRRRGFSLWLVGPWARPGGGADPLDKNLSIVRHGLNNYMVVHPRRLFLDFKGAIEEAGIPRALAQRHLHIRPDLRMNREVTTTADAFMKVLESALHPAATGLATRWGIKTEGPAS